MPEKGEEGRWQETVIHNKACVCSQAQAPHVLSICLSATCRPKAGRITYRIKQANLLKLVTCMAKTSKPLP